MPEFKQLLQSTTAATVAQLRKDGRKVVLMEPWPVESILNNVDPVECLSQAKALEECSFVANLRPTPLEMQYRSMAKHDAGVTSIDIDHLLCPSLPICDPVVNGVIVKKDFTHITTPFSASIGPAIEAALDGQGVFQH